MNFLLVEKPFAIVALNNFSGVKTDPGLSAHNGIFSITEHDAVNTKRVAGFAKPSISNNMTFNKNSFPGFHDDGLG